jgi:hypothetical protein
MNHNVPVTAHTLVQLVSSIVAMVPTMEKRVTVIHVMVISTVQSCVQVQEIVQTPIHVTADSTEAGEITVSYQDVQVGKRTVVEMENVTLPRVLVHV